MSTHRQMEDKKYCTCCGNLVGCDCFGQGSQKRHIKECEARELTALSQRDALKKQLAIARDRIKKLESRLAARHKADVKRINIGAFKFDEGIG